MFHISTQDKYTHFQKKSAKFFHLKTNIQCTNLNTTQVKEYTQLGLENIGEIYIWPIIMFYRFH